MIAEVLNIIKKNLFLISLVALISLFSYQLGRISGPKDEPIKVERANIQGVLNEQNSDVIDVNESRGVERIDFRVVVSKNSDKYHFLWCSGAERIKEENKVYFNSEEEAIKAGYTLALNCSK